MLAKSNSVESRREIRATDRLGDYFSFSFGNIMI